MSTSNPNKEKQTVVFASGNAGKIKEMNDLLAPLGYEVQSQQHFGVESVPETAVTFVENALIKARHASQQTGFAAIADDSGLEVDALDGAPGLYSARFAEMHNAGSGDADNNTLLLEKLKGIPDEKRSARFRSVVVLLRHENDPSPIIAQGVWEGRILHAIEGDGGFGYDPLFFNFDTQQSSALLSKALKNQLSHRGKAVQSLLEQLAQTV